MENPEDSEDETYPGLLPGLSSRTSGQKGLLEEDEEEEEDRVRVVQRDKKGKKISDLKRKSRDEDEDEDESGAWKEWTKHTKEPAKEKPTKLKQPASASADEEEEEEEDEEDLLGARRESSYRLWCKNAHKLFKVVDVAVVRESRHAVSVNTHDHYGQLVASNAESLWKHVCHADPP